MMLMIMMMMMKLTVIDPLQAPSQPLEVEMSLILRVQIPKELPQALIASLLALPLVHVGKIV
jgi:hypothetical protein